MTFRRSAPLILILAVVLVIAALCATSSALFSGLTQSVERNQFELMRAIVETALQDAQSKALARAELIADLPSTQRLLAAGDRAGLLADLGPMFTTQNSRHGVDQAQFHVPPATSFLRLHDPTTFGDDLTAFRPMVVSANRDKVPMKSVAIARSGPAIFGIAPVTDTSGRHLGTFEIGISFGPFLAGLKSAYGLDLALFVEEGLLRDFAKGIDPERLGEENRVGSYIRFESTNAAKMADLAGPEDLAVVTAPTSYTRPSGGVVQGVVLIPVTNGAGTPLGVIAAARDFSGSRAAAGRSLVWQVALGLGAIVILCCIILVVLRGLLIRPLQVLGQRFAALLSGEGPLEPIAGADRFVGELQPFVSLYDRIRRRRADAGGRP